MMKPYAYGIDVAQVTRDGRVTTQTTRTDDLVRTFDAAAAAAIAHSANQNTNAYIVAFLPDGTTPHVACFNCGTQVY